MTEQEFPRVLFLRDLVKDRVNRGAFDHPIESDAGHDRRAASISPEWIAVWLGEPWDLLVRMNRSSNNPLILFGKEVMEN